MSTTSTTIFSVGLGIFVLFVIFLWIESREDDGEGRKVFSAEKLGATLKMSFGVCLPDSFLLFFAKIFICCGYVGNSCMEHVHADEEIRETKRLARIAANLSRKSGSSAKKKKKSKSRKDETDFEALADDDDDDIESASGESRNTTSSSSKKHSSHRSGSSSSGGSGMEMRDPPSSNHLTTSSVAQHQKDDHLHDQNYVAAPLPTQLCTQELFSRPIATSATATRILPSYASKQRHELRRRDNSRGSSSRRDRLDLSLQSDGSDSESSGIFINELVPKSMIEAHIAAEDKMVSEYGAHY